jgi:rubredoxin
MSNPEFKKYMCLICGFIYDENWTCPECQARKEDFEMVEI